MKKLTILNSPIEKEKQFSLEREIFKRQKDYASLKQLKKRDRKSRALCFENARKMEIFFRINAESRKTSMPMSDIQMRYQTLFSPTTATTNLFFRGSIG